MSKAVLDSLKMHKTKNNLPENVRIKNVKILNEALANLLNLKLQVKQAHWNVKGMRFIALHELFDMLAQELEKYVDLIAERATTIGGTALGTLEQIRTNTCLPEYPIDIVSGEDHLYALIDRYAIVAEKLRQNIEAADSDNDKDTADIFTEVSRNIDLRLWFLEAHIQDR